MDTKVWEKMAFFYYFLFTLMCSCNILDLNNVWHMDSLHIIFLPLIQSDVDHHIFAWNNYCVHKIKENIQDISSHVRKATFKVYE